MKTDRRYKPKEEVRNWYFVQYHPLNFDDFAHLALTITIENAVKNDVITAMEKEAEIWLSLYPVPLLVSAFDNTDTVYDFSEIKEQNILMGFVNASGKICLYWRPLKKDEEGPNKDLSKEYLDNLYLDFSFTTFAEYDANRKKRNQQIENGLILFLVIPFVVTVAWESFIYFNKYLSFLAFLYILYKAIQKALQLVSMWPKSKREKEKEREQVLKDHYYYFCKTNPEGFEKLKLDTLEKMAKERVKKEAESLKIKNHLS